MHFDVKIWINSIVPITFNRYFVFVFSVKSTEMLYEARCLGSYTGYVLWVPAVILTSTCAVKLAKFPFDEQECTLKFGSWTYSQSEINLKHYADFKGIDLDEYKRSGGWVILDSPARIELKRYSCCKNAFITMSFTLKLKRGSLFYVFVLVMPCLLLVFLTFVIFFLPPNSGEKVNMGK